MSKPVEIEFLMKDKLTPGMDKAGREALELRNTVRLLEAELERLRLAGETAAPNLDQRANIAQIDSLGKQLEGLRSKLKQVQEESESVQVTPADMPNAQRQFNGLHNSIQQIAREMPSLAMGPQMFFLAISNNLPIFTDELARARKEYDELRKSGKKGTPVWKQVLSSLFSWQTALTTGIMLLVMYGDEIWDWTKDLFSAKKGVDEFNISLKEMAEIEKDGRARMVRTRFELKSVIDEIKNFTGSKEQEKAKVEELNRKYGESFGYYKTLSGWYDTLIRKGEDYVQVLLHQANVQSLVNKAAKADEEVNKIKAQKPEEAESAMGFFGKLGQYAIQSDMAKAGQFYDARAAIKEHDREAYGRLLKKAENKRDAYLKKAEEELEKAAGIGKRSGIGGHTGPKQPGTNPETEARHRMATERWLAQELAALRRENQQSELELMKDGTEKKLAQINADYEAQKDAIAKQARELAGANKEAGAAGVNGNGLTAAQQDEIDKANRLNEATREKQVKDTYRAELQYMQDYLKQYGTFQQQKLAIAQEYDEKIARAGNHWQRQSLEAEKASALQQVEMEAIRQSIDWGSVFGSFGTLFKEQLQPAIDKLKAIAASDGFQSSPLQDRQTLYELIAKLEQAGASWDSGIFKRVSDDLAAYQQAVQRHIEAQERETVAARQLAEARQRLAKAEKSGDPQAFSNAQALVLEAQSVLAGASDDVEAFGTQVQQATSDLQSSSQQAVAMFQTLESGIQGLASGSLEGIGGGIMSLDKLFGGSLTEDAGNALAKGFQRLLGEDSKAAAALTEALGSTGMAGQIISAVLGLLDVLAQHGFSGIISGVIDSAWGAVNQIIADTLSGDILLKPLKSVRDGLHGLADTLTFGGFDSWFGIGGNADEVQAAIDRLTSRNELLQGSIEALTGTMKQSRGRVSVSAAQQAMLYQKEQNANYLKIAQEQARYSGAHHSWNKYFKGFNQEQVTRLSGQIGRQWDGNLWNLSPEEMKALRGNADMWDAIIKAGKGGYGGRVGEDLEAYIAQAGKLEDIRRDLYEGLTGISFDGLYDNFIDTLMDMDASAKDAAEDMSEYFMRAMLSNKIGELYYDKLEAWWNKFGASMESDGLSEIERKDLQDEYMRYIEEALQLRDQLAAATGYGKAEAGGTGQSAKSGGFTAMTQDQGTKLEGMFTSGLQHWSSMDDRLESVSEKMDTAEGHLARIAENTGVSAGHLGELKEVIKKMIRDGLKVK